MELSNVRLKAIKPALSGYIRKALLMLDKEPVPDEKVIHDVRVLMKKARAALKLVSSQLEKEYITRNVLEIREVGRKMCYWRETAVLRKELIKFRKGFSELFLFFTDNEKINAILKEPVGGNLSSENIKSELEEIKTMLRKTGFRIRFETMTDFDPHLLLRDLGQTYEKVADSYLISRNNPKPEKLHEFRKRAKDLLYQLYFFRPVNPSGIKVMEKKLENITKNLGKYNNLSQLIKALDYDYSLSKYPPALDELVLKIRDKQDIYLSRVWSDAIKLFCPGQKLINLLGFKLLII